VLDWGMRAPPASRPSSGSRPSRPGRLLGRVRSVPRHRWALALVLLVVGALNVDRLAETVVVHVVTGRVACQAGLSGDALSIDVGGPSFTVVSVSPAYPDRPPSLLVRVYVDVRL
jgi:hypothetical protein